MFQLVFVTPWQAPVPPRPPPPPFCISQATLNAFLTASAHDRARLSLLSFYLACAKRQFKSASCPDIIIHGLFGIHCFFVVFYSIYNKNVICAGET